MKKTLFLLFLLCSIYSNGQLKGRDILIDRMSRITETPLPLFTTPELKSRVSYGVRPDMTPTINFHSYDDLGGKVNFGPLVAGELYSWSKSLYNYKIAIIDMGEVDRYRMLLTTLSEQAAVIDTVEVEIYFYSGNNRYLTKEFILDTNQQLIVCQLESKEDAPIGAYSGFNKYNAQRVDTYYQINSEGEIVPLKRKLYKPRVYDAAYIKDGKKRLLDGDEEIEREVEISAE